MVRLIAPDDWRPKGIESLEDNAMTVVRSSASYSVVAGPGAGKTELLAQRASFLLETGACPSPRRILAISFKRDAAKNLRERIQRRSGDAFGRRFDSYTFDAFSKGIVDQFLSALPERLRPTAEYDVLPKLEQPDVEEILKAMSPPHELGDIDDLLGFAKKSFFEDEVPRAPLNREPSSLKEWAALQFWYALLEGPRSKLSFKMIMRLAGYLLKQDPRLLRAYRSTYSHVFLDEFQDTTTLQYGLTKILFHETDAVLTAVGDPHQRIMGWAGARKNIFVEFGKGFGATEIPLFRNYRASQELAPLVRFLAAQMHASLAASGEEIPAIEPGSGPPADACSAHIFDNEIEEAEWIATQVHDLIAADVPPREIALLARIKTAQYARVAMKALEAKGVAARLEDALQDVLAEPIVQCSVLGLRALASAAPRAHWSEFRELIADARGLDVQDGRRWEQLEAELTRARAAFSSASPVPPADTEELRSLIRSHLEPLLAPARVGYRQYARGTYYDDCLQQLAAAIAAEAHWGSWNKALDGVEGIGTVPILTIHKSKGLEYEAVFFVGLEDGAFWNFARQPDEEMNAFYVAVSRAKRRVVFTFSRVRKRGSREERQSLREIRKIYDLMVKAEVHVESHAKQPRPPDGTSVRRAVGG
jgi:superfamily I DNA/RNA helicase